MAPDQMAGEVLYDPGIQIDDIFGGAAEGGEILPAESGFALPSGVEINAGGQEIELQALFDGQSSSLTFSGSISFLGETLAGQFTFSRGLTENGVQGILVEADDVSVNFGAGGFGLGLENGFGGFLLTSAGVVGAVEGDVTILGFGGFNLNDSMTLAFNTTGGVVEDRFTTGNGTTAVDYSNGSFIQLEGSATVALDEFVYVTGHFVVPQISRVDVGLSDGETTRDMLLLSIGASNVHVFAGVNGPDWVDSDDDGQMDPAEINEKAIGISLHDVDVGVALMRPTFLADPARFYALKVTAQSASFLGIPGVDFSLSGITIEVNGGGDYLADPIDPPVVDFTSFAGGSLQVGPGGDEVILDMGDATARVSVQNASLQISEFIFVQGSLEIQKGLTTEVTLGDGEVKEVETLTIGVASAHLFAGLNGPYWVDSNQDGAIDQADTPDSESIGIALGGVDVGIAFLSPTSLTDFTNYFSLKVTADFAGLVGLGEILAVEARGITIGVNTVDDPFDTPLSPAEAIDYTQMAEGGLALPTGGPPVLLDFEGELLQVIVEDALIKVSDFIFIRGGFAFEQGRSTEVVLADGEEKEVDVVTIGAHDVYVFAGINGPYWRDSNNDGVLDSNDVPDPESIGIALANVDVGLALFTGAALTDFTSYLSLKITADSAALVGLADIIEVEARNITVGVNTVDDPFDTVFNPAEAIDFTQMEGGFDIPTGGEPVTLDWAGELLQVRVEQATISIADFIFIRGGFAFEKGRTLDVVLGDGEIKEVESLTIGASNVHVFAGLNGPYWVDSNNDGAIDENDTPESDSIGIALGDVDFGLAIFEATSLTDFASYFALKVTADFAGFVGLSDYLQLEAHNITFGINQADDPLATPLNPAECIDFSQLQGGGFAVPAGADGQEVLIDFDSELLQVMVEDATIKIGEFVFVRGGFAFEKGRSVEVTLTDGTVKEVDSVTIGASDVHVFVGIGGPYWRDTNGNGALDDNDTPDPDSIGFALGDVDVGLAIFEGSALTDFTSYMALKVTADYAGLVGTSEVIQLEAHDLLIGVNVADDPFTTPFNPPPAIDFTKMEDGGFAVPTGQEDASVLIDFEDEILTLSAGWVELQISEFVFISGSFAFEKGRTVEVTLSDGTTIRELETMTVGASNVSAFVGIGGPYWNDANGNGNIDQGETNENAIGLAFSDVDFGLVLLKPTNVLNPSDFFALKATAEQVALVGVPEIELSAEQFSIEVNGGGDVLASLLFPPAVDFTSLPGGYLEVATGGASVRIDSDDAIISAAGIATLRISEFIYLSGHVAFEQGRTTEVQFTEEDGILASNELEFLTVGGQNLFAFIGFNGPYQVDSDHDGEVDAINPDAVGIYIEDLDFALAFMRPTNPLDSSKYFALKAQADNLGFTGVPELEITAQDVLVEVNLGSGVSLDGTFPAVDFAASFSETGGYEVPTGPDSSITLDMSESIIHARSSLVVANIAGLVSITGGFDFSFGPLQTVTLSNGDTDEVRTMTIAATNVYGFVGINGPYWSDTNNDGQIITDQSSAQADTPNTDAMGLSLEDLDFGMALMVENQLILPNKYLALSASVDRLHLVGLDFIEADITASLELNLGLGITSGLAVIDWQATYPPNPAEGKTRAGLELSTGSDSVWLDYTELFVRAHIIGDLILYIPGSQTELFQLDGELFLSVTPSELKFFVDADLIFGGVEMAATGGLMISDDGLAALLDVNLNLGDALPLPDGFVFNLSTKAMINTTGQDVVFNAPTKSGEQPLTRQAGDDGVVFVSGTSPLGGDPGAYIVLATHGTISIYGTFLISGSFQIIAAENGFEVTASGAMEMRVAGATIMSFTVSGGFRVTEEGMVMALNLAPKFQAGLGFSLNAQFTLEVNTTDSAVEINGHSLEAGPFVRVHADGRMVVGGFSIDGFFDFVANNSGILIAVDAQLQVGPIGALHVGGELGLLRNGIYARLSLGLGGGDTVGGGSIGFDLNGSFELQLNTTGTVQNGIAPGVRVEIQGSLKFYGGVVTASGRLVLFYSGSQFRMEFQVLMSLAGSIRFSAHGFAAIYGGSNPGFVLSLTVAINAEFDILSIFKLGVNANGDLKINTRNVDTDGIERNSFTLSIHNAEINVFDVLKLRGGITVQVNSQGWRVEIPATRALTLDFFGIATIYGHGYFNSRGEFDLTIGGGLVIGSRSFGIIGSFNIYAAYENEVVRFGGSASASIVLFGFSFASVGVSFGYNSGTGKISIAATVTLDFFFFEIDFTIRFSIGVFKFTPAYLAGLFTDGSDWRGVDAGGDGTLYLNVGSRAGMRQFLGDESDEGYKIIHVEGDPNSPLGETIQVKAFGKTRQYTGVKKIVGDFGDGNDFIHVEEGVLAPVDLRMGSGNDNVTYDGNGGGAIDLGGDMDSAEIGRALQAALHVFGGSGEDRIVNGAYRTVTIDGGSDEDFLYGSNASDLILGGTGPDHIFGGGGNDELHGGDGNDIIEGGDGHDLIYSGAGNDDVYAGNGNDRVFGWFGADRLFGESGADQLYGEADDDYIEGGSGDDLIDGGDGSDEIFGNLGLDTIYGRNGNDLIYGNEDADTLYGGTGDDTIFGNTGNDLILGEEDNDVLFGNEGNDRLFGHAGIDILLGDNGAVARGSFIVSHAGGNGEDYLEGNENDDILVGGGGNDVIEGNDGNDVIAGDAANATLSGFSLRTIEDFTVAGNDTLRGRLGNDVILGGLGADELFGDEGDDVIIGDGGWISISSPGTIEISSRNATVGAADRIFGAAGNDLLIGGMGGDFIQGDAGIDVLIGDNGHAITADWKATFVETIAAGFGAGDEIFGNEQADLIFGGTGADKIDGASGADILVGDQGIASLIDLVVVQVQSNDITADQYGGDLMDGDTDENILIGGLGNDILRAGTANDVFGADQVIVLRFGDGRLHSITSIDGTRGGNDSISTGAGDNIVIAGQGQDLVFGDSGHDTILGDNGSLVMATPGVRDLLISTDTAFGGNDLIFARFGNDIVFGGHGADEVYGEAGDDLIVGDSGELDYVSGLRGSVRSISPAFGASDRLIADAGDNLVIGGAGDDVITAAGGADILIGDQGEFFFSNTLVQIIRTIDGALNEIGADQIEAGTGNNIILGGLGSDSLVALEGNDTIFGDQGELELTAAGVQLRIQSLDAARGGNDYVRTGDGHNNIIAGQGMDDVQTGRGNDFLAGDNALLTRNASGELILAGIQAPAEGAADLIASGSGDDIVLGGLGADNIETGAGADLVVGDNGQVTHLAGIRLQITTSNQASGHSDLVSTGPGDDIIFGGTANDIVDAGSGADILLGDHGFIDYIDGLVRFISARDGDAADAGADLLHGGDGNNIVIGGLGNDTATTMGGHDIIFGDQGEITLLASGVRSLITSADPARGGEDHVTSGGGDDFVIGGLGSDVIVTSEGADIILSDHGIIQITPANNFNLISSSDASLGGEDVVDAGAGENIVLGGDGADVIVSGDDQDTLFGDNASLSYLEGVIVSITTLAQNVGSDDTISSGGGGDLVLGGFGGDTIRADDGDDTVLGDNGTLNYTAGILFTIKTIAPDQGAADSISGGGDDDLLFGGTAGDSIDAAGGDDFILGDQGIVTFTDGVISLVTTNDGATAEFGNDGITAGDGNNVVLGGLGADSIVSLSGRDVVLGDQGTLTLLQTGVWIEIVTHDFARGGNDVIDAGPGDDLVMGGFGLDLVSAGAGDDVALGDNGHVTQHATGLRSIIQTIEPTNGSDDVIFGGPGNDRLLGGTARDTLHGDEDNDLIFGDHGRIDFSMPANDNFRAIDTDHLDGGEGDLIFGGAGDDNILGQQGDDVVYAQAGDDDVWGGHNVHSGIDELTPGQNDRLDGGSGHDVVLGDNGSIIRRGDAISLRVRQLVGSLLYNADGSAAVSDQWQPAPTGVAGRDIVIFDHAVSVNAGTWGNDFIAGGAGDDLLFGQLGDDVIQGDGSIDYSLTAGSASADTDGDDYIEGNGGNDTIYGNLGQDDLIGGSSDLFGLVTSTQRPDGSDTIYGGSGLDLARNSMGDQSPTGHARDADTVLGDNGRIFRPIRNGSYLTFSYDNYSELRIVPRAVELIDYSANGLDSDDIGASDLIHGEAGDDSIHGTTGNDVLYGDSQDDDLYGESGADWISGGSGEDGVLGDDGKILTSRNGVAEPLYGVAATTQSTFTSKALAVSYQLNITGEVKKSVDLEPFEIGANDLIYGGLGDDFLHGGAGNDSISGAEALANFYTAPGTTPILVYDPVTREFIGYNENDPLRKIAGHSLNFEAFNGDPLHKVYDGRDTLFGDLGHDWLVGGTEADHLYGGLGDDLLNADDNLETNGGLNNAADAGLYGDGDLAYGGGGLDYFLGNTGADRLIDSHGEFNSYVVPFSAYGAATVIRALNPDTRDLLYLVSASDGADQTRVSPTLGSLSRNGEPYGELGLIMQGDDEAGAQTGAPSDPQPGTAPGRKDTRK